MRAYDFSRLQWITDVGGGSGAFIGALLAQAGFSMQRIVTTDASIAVVEALA